MKSTITTLFFCFFFISISKGQKFRTVVNDGRFETEEVLVNNSTRKVSTDDYSNYVTVSNDVAHPWKEVKVTIHYPEELDIDKLKFLVLNIARYGKLDQLKSIYVPAKTVDKLSREYSKVIGGFDSNQSYSLQVIHNVDVPDPNYPTSGDILAEKPFLLDHPPVGLVKKMLMVVDSSLNENLNVRQRIDDYINYNTNIYPDIAIDKFLMGEAPNEKLRLFSKVKEQYAREDSCLSYLFFVGDNADIDFQRIYLNYDNSVYAQYDDFGMNLYAQVLNSPYQYDSAANKLRNKTYYYYKHAGLPALDIGNSLMQSNSYDLSYGMIIPHGILSEADYVVDYFDKLKEYKKGNISVNKSVLFADTHYEDGSLPAELSTYFTRWNGTNDRVAVNYKYPFDYHGPYPEWFNDYYSKLQNNSYEIVTFLGHGAWNLHYYGITKENINAIFKRSLIYDLSGCSIGGYRHPDFLASAYLSNGYGLFVKAYSQTILKSNIGNKSPLILDFQNNWVFDLMHKGYFWSDAYAYGQNGLDPQILLGDPLLQFDPPCSRQSLALNSIGQFDSGLNYRVSDSISISTRIPWASKLDFTAGKKIELLPGFEAYSYGILSSYSIKACPE